MTPTQRVVSRFGVDQHQQRTDERVAHEASDLERQKIRQYWDKVRKPRIEKHFSSAMYRFGPPRLQVVLNTTESLGSCDVKAQPDAPQVYEFPVYLKRIECDIRIKNSYSVPKTTENFFMQADMPRPELWVDWIEIEGPIYNQWPPSKIVLARRFRILGEPSEEARAKAILIRFMTRAFRRPIRRGELQQMMELYSSARKSKGDLRRSATCPFDRRFVLTGFPLFG